MNFSALLGLVAAFGVFIVTMVTSTKEYNVFLDYHAFLIVMGGTVAVSLLSFSGSKLLALLKVFFKRVLKPSDDLRVALEEIIDVAKGYRENSNYRRKFCLR